MATFRVTDTRRFALNRLSVFETRAQKIREHFGEDYEKWFRTYYVRHHHETILVDAGTAIMTQQEFDDLPEYSCSLPSGTYFGKRWTCNRHAFMRDAPPEPNWWMAEYVEDYENKDKVHIIWRKVILV